MSSPFKALRESMKGLFSMMEKDLEDMDKHFSEAFDMDKLLKDVAKGFENLEPGSERIVQVVEERPGGIKITTTTTTRKYGVAKKATDKAEVPHE